MIDTTMYVGVFASILGRFFFFFSLSPNVLLLFLLRLPSSSSIPAISNSKGKKKKRSSSQLNQYPGQRSAFANMLPRIAQRICHRKRETERSFNDNNVYIEKQKKNVQECLKCCCTRRRDQEKKLSRIDDGCTRKHKHSKSYTTSFEFIKSSDKPTSD